MTSRRSSFALSLILAGTAVPAAVDRSSAVATDHARRAATGESRSASRARSSRGLWPAADDVRGQPWPDGLACGLCRTREGVRDLPHGWRRRHTGAVTFSRVARTRRLSQDRFGRGLTAFLTTPSHRKLRPLLCTTGVSETQKGAAVRLVLDAARTGVRGVGQDRLQTHVSYLTGRDRNAWHENVPSLARWCTKTCIQVSTSCTTAINRSSSTTSWSSRVRRQRHSIPFRRG